MEFTRSGIGYIGFVQWCFVWCMMRGILYTQTNRRETIFYFETYKIYINVLHTQFRLGDYMVMRFVSFVNTPVGIGLKHN